MAIAAAHPPIREATSERRSYEIVGGSRCDDKHERLWKL
jgi:hypothetical protein